MSATLVAERGRVQVAVVAEEFGVTMETVRRDLAVLERAGHLRRVHGGAVPSGALALVEPGLGERHGTRTEQKRKIAAAALDLLPGVDGSLILDGGSTTAALADVLPVDRRLYVATNSVPIATRLSVTTGVTLHVLGGRVRASRRPPSATRPSARWPTCASTSSSSAPTGSAPGTASPPPTRRRRPPSGRWCVRRSAR